MPDADAGALLANRAAAAQPQMLAQVLAWSAINSGSQHLEGLARMAEVLAGAFGRLAPVERLRLAPQQIIGADGVLRARPLGQALRLRVRPEARWQVLLVGHYDTVYGAADAFQQPRWNADGTLNGPGVADLKGGLAVMLAALEAFESGPAALKTALGWTVLLNPDEEIGSPGSAPLLAAEAARHDVGLVFEPSALPDGTLAGARKGSGNFTVTLRGRAAHAGRNPQDGRNAIVAAADCVLGLAALAEPAQGLTVNPAKIDGGGAVNVVPDLAVVRFNVRLAEPAQQAGLLAAVQQLCAAIHERHGCTAELAGGFTRPPKPLDARQRALHDFVAGTGAQLGLTLGTRDTGGVCDGNNLAAAGLANVDTLGVRGGAIHSPDEFLIVDSLAERARLATRLLVRLAAGELDRTLFARETRCC